MFQLARWNHSRWYLCSVARTRTPDYPNPTTSYLPLPTGLRDGGGRIYSPSNAAGRFPLYKRTKTREKASIFCSINIRHCWSPIDVRGPRRPIQSCIEPTRDTNDRTYEWDHLLTATCTNVSVQLGIYILNRCKRYTDRLVRRRAEHGELRQY